MPSPSLVTRRRAALVATLAAAAALGGCDKTAKAPSGQVVATVDGDDITRRDVQTEIAAAKLPDDVDVKKVQPLVVDQIVNRKLLVEEAKKEKLDKSPEYLAAEQRARETVLAEMLVQRWASKVTPTTPDQAQNFIVDNPQMFGERKILLIDQLRTSPAGLQPEELRPLNSMDEIIAYLTAHKHPFARSQATIDTLTVPKAVVTQIEGLAPGMPFVLQQNGALLINVVVGQKPAPVPDNQSAKLATQAVTKTAAEKIVRDQIASLRQGAKVEYQKGFAPPPKPVTPAAAKPAG